MSINHITCGEVTIPYEIVRSKRRSLAIIIKPGGKMIVRVPLRISDREVNSFLLSKREWIVRMYEKQCKTTMRGIKIQDGATIPLLGNPYLLTTISSKDTRRPTAELKKDNLVITFCDNNKYSLIDIIEQWYKGMARTIITERVKIYASQMNVSYGKIAIRNQLTRWGSCSAKGNLNFNWHLVMMPVEVLDYVVIHELAHRLEMNHSKRFWTIVENFCIDYKKRKEWLRVHGGDYQTIE